MTVKEHEVEQKILAHLETAIAYKRPGEAESWAAAYASLKAGQLMDKQSRKIMVY